MEPKRAADRGIAGDSSRQAAGYREDRCEDSGAGAVRARHSPFHGQVARPKQAAQDDARHLRRLRIRAVAGVFKKPSGRQLARILEQAERSLPSALVAPNMGDYNKAVGVGSQIALTSIGADCALKTSTPGEMFGTAVAAQLASSGADSLVERTTNWLSHAERTQEDVGASAIYLAWIFKFMLDRERTSESHKLSWRLGMTALTGAAVVVIPLAESSQGGKLDAVAHGVSLVVAYGAHRFGLRKRSNGGELYLERAGA